MGKRKSKEKLGTEEISQQTNYLRDRLTVLFLTLRRERIGSDQAIFPIINPDQQQESRKEQRTENNSPESEQRNPEYHAENDNQRMGIRYLTHQHDTAQTIHIGNHQKGT